MTPIEMLTALGVLAGLFAAVFGFWKYLDHKFTAAATQIAAANASATLASAEVSTLRIHVAETYVTKAGMSEQTQQIMKAIESIGSRIDTIGNRIDGLYASKPPRRSSAT